MCKCLALSELVKFLFLISQQQAPPSCSTSLQRGSQWWGSEEKAKCLAPLRPRHEWLFPAGQRGSRQLADAGLDAQIEILDPRVAAFLSGLRLQTALGGNRTPHLPMSTQLLPVLGVPSWESRRCHFFPQPFTFCRVELLHRRNCQGGAGRLRKTGGSLRTISKWVSHFLSRYCGLSFSGQSSTDCL